MPGHTTCCGSVTGCPAAAGGGASRQRRAVAAKQRRDSPLNRITGNVVAVKAIRGDGRGDHDAVGSIGHLLGQRRHVGVGAIGAMLQIDQPNRRLVVVREIPRRRTA